MSFVIRDKKLLPHQERLITSTKPTKVMMCGRASGKSYAAARLIVLRLIAGFNLIVSAQTHKTLKKVLWGEVIKVLKKWKIPYEVNTNDMRITVKVGCEAYADFYTASSVAIENVRGLSNYKTWVGDEGALASREWRDVVYACLRGERNDGKPVGEPEEVIITTPKGIHNWLSRYIKEIPEDKLEYIHATTMDNTSLDAGYIASLKRTYDSSFYRQEIEGLILSDDEPDQFIPWNLIDKCINYSDDSAFGDRVLGIDMARFGDDKIECYHRNGKISSHVFEAQKEDSFTLFNRVTNLYKPSDLDIINIDTTGGSNSSGLVDLLIKAGYNVNEVNFSAASPMKEYANMRAYIYAALKEAMKLGMRIPDDDVLNEELAAQRFKIREADGKLMLIPKDLIKKVLFRSPDKSDGLALTFAHTLNFDNLFFTNIDNTSETEQQDNTRAMLEAIAASSNW